MISHKLESGKSKVKDRKRSMSSHVCSRWYRAPEIVILEKIYDQSADIWSLGCCLFELMKVIKKDNNTQ